MEETTQLEPQPEELAKQETEQQEGGIDPIALASGTFGMLYPRFIMHLNGLSRKSMLRVIRALVGVPLEEKLPNWKDPNEKTTYLIGERLMEAKSVIIIDTFYKKQLELEKLKTETNTEQAVEETVKENNNGENL